MAYTNETEPNERRVYRDQCPNKMHDDRCFYLVTRITNFFEEVKCTASSNCPNLEWYDKNVLGRKKYYG